ncbi:MAG TPA: hypothetical protein VF163_11185 [Micromonosporaceae bacterium]
MTGFAVFREWPDGAHDIFGFVATPGRAQRALEADRHFWRAGPLRPVRHRVVAISRADFALHGHRPWCRSPDCP